MKPIGGHAHQLFDGARPPRSVRRNMKRSERQRTVPRAIAEHPTNQQLYDDAYMLAYDHDLALGRDLQRDWDLEAAESHARRIRAAIDWTPSEPDRSQSIRIRALKVHAELWRAMNDTPENALAALRDDGYLHAAVHALLAGDDAMTPAPDAWAAHVAAQDERIARLEAELEEERAKPKLRVIRREAPPIVIDEDEPDECSCDNAGRDLEDNGDSPHMPWCPAREKAEGYR